VANPSHVRSVGSVGCFSMFSTALDHLTIWYLANCAGIVLDEFLDVILSCFSWFTSVHTGMGRIRRKALSWYISRPIHIPSSVRKKIWRITECSLNDTIKYHKGTISHSRMRHWWLKKL